MRRIGHPVICCHIILNEKAGFFRKRSKDLSKTARYFVICFEDLAGMESLLPFPASAFKRQILPCAASGHSEAAGQN